MKKLFSILFIIVLTFGALTATPAMLTDIMILTDPVRETYAGAENAEVLIANLNFADLPDDQRAAEAIVRNGALNLFKHYDDDFKPDGYVSNLDALEYVLRAIGMENRAHDAAINQERMLPPNSPLRAQWTVGYIYTAWQLRLIERYDYLDSLVADQSQLNPESAFVYGGPVTRQQFAAWLYNGLRINEPELFDTDAPRQRIFNFDDWDFIDADKIAAVEAMTLAGVFADIDGSFVPNGKLTRAEAAVILKNLDIYYYGMLGIEKKAGTVGAVRLEQTNTTAGATVRANIYIRNSIGQIDLLNNYFEASTSPRLAVLDAPVFKDSEVAGLSSLAEGDMVEYLVRPETNEVVYVQVLKPSPVMYNRVRGRLQGIDARTGSVTIKDGDEMLFTFPMIDGMYFAGQNPGADRIIIDDKWHSVINVPHNIFVELELVNDVCVGINWFNFVVYAPEPPAPGFETGVINPAAFSFERSVKSYTFVRNMGEVVVDYEFRGIVIENDTDFGFLTVIDNMGNELTRFFYPDDLTVKKKQYYDAEDEVGYISQVFPYFKFNPVDSSVYELEPGDVVFIRFDPRSDPDMITEISASTNYIAKYGKILQFRPAGDYFEMLLEYENKQSSWFTVPNGIFVSKNGRPVTMASVMPGDWAKALINQAVMAPGYVVESVKELVVENDGRYISNIFKGQMAGIDAVQNQLLLQDVYRLSGEGWTDYKNADKFDISGKGIDYYLNGRQISADYAVRYLKRSDNVVYIALENNYAGEKVKKISFYSGRDELLPPDTVIGRPDSFAILSYPSAIGTDDGTIVRRYGRLVDGNSIEILDYAVVSLNGGQAAVVDITDAPFNAAVLPIRARVVSVDEGKSFKVQSVSVLTGAEWFYTPIVREFTIDHDTVFLNEAGVMDHDAFIGYTASSVVDKVYNIIADGGRAAYVSDAPYAQKQVRGAVYGVTAGGAYIFDLKDTSYYNNDSGAWLPTGLKDTTSSVTVAPNTLIIKNNAVVSSSEIKPGDQIRVLTDTFNASDDLENPELSREITGYIIFAEK